MLVQTREQFEAVRTTLECASIIACDTETTGLLPWSGDKMVGVSFYAPYPGTEYFLSVYLPFRHEPAKAADLFTFSENLPIDWLAELRPLFADPQKEWVWHNNKFDRAILYNEGIVVGGRITDVGWLSTFSHTEGSHRLKDLAEKHFGGDAKEAQRRLFDLLGDKKRFADTHPKQMEEYACADAQFTYWLRETFLEDLARQNLLSVKAKGPLGEMYLTEREERFTHVLFEMEKNGVLFDPELATQLEAETVREMRRLEDELGFDPGRKNELARRLFGAPPVGLGFRPQSFTKLTSPDFPQGIPATDQEFLARLDHPLPRKVVEYRSHVKARSTWYKGYRDQADASGCVIHPQYNHNSIRTSRLSASKPNIQQVPREDEGEKVYKRVKRLFRCPPGYELWEFDQAQIEYRMGAQYAEDWELIEQFKAGDDTHQIGADALGCSRQTYKHVTYTICYGGGAPTLANTLEKLERLTTGRIITVPEEEAAEILNAWHRLHPGFKKKANECTNLARRRGYIKLWTGRVRHFDNPKMYHKAFNTLLQGGAAEVMKDAMLLIASEPREYQMVAQVHDSIWFYVPVGRPDLREEIVHLMEWPNRDERFMVPFEVDSKCLYAHAA
jgi:DNA polymerase-1